MTVSAPVAAGMLADYEDQMQGVRLLGRILWYSCRQSTVRHATLVDDLMREGLGDYAPRPPSDADVFRRVCSNAQANRLETDRDGVYVNVLIRNVDGGTDEIVKRVVEEQVDPTGRRLRYTETHDVMFRRNGSVVEVNPLAPPWEHSQAQTVANSIAPRFYQESGSVNESALREMLRRVLDANHAILVRPTGGVFFVPEEHAEAAEKLRRVAQRLPGVSFRSLPLIDDPDQRDMITDSFEKQALDEIDTTIAEITEMLKSSSDVSDAKAHTFLNRYRTLRERADTYRQLLQDDLAGTVTRLDVFSTQVSALLNRVGS